MFGLYHDTHRLPKCSWKPLKKLFNLWPEKDFHNPHIGKRAINQIWKLTWSGNLAEDPQFQYDYMYFLICMSDFIFSSLCHVWLVPFERVKINNNKNTIVSLESSLNQLTKSLQFPWMEVIEKAEKSILHLLHVRDISQERVLNDGCHLVLIWAGTNTGNHLILGFVTNYPGKK